MTEDNYFLITTALEETWIKRSRVVFLGEWCRLFSRKKEWDKINATVAPYHWDNQKKLIDDYNYASDLFERILPLISKNLNSFHNVNYSTRYWRILIGPWMSYFIQILIDRWSNVETVSRNYSSLETIEIVGHEDNLVPNDMPEFGRLITGDEWNHYIYCQVIKNFSNIIFCERKNSDIFLNISVSKKLDKTFKNKIFDIYVFCFKKFFAKNDVFVIGSYLNIFRQLRLHLKLGQMPQLWTRVQTPSVTLDPSARNWSIDGAWQSDFEEFVASIVIKQIPRVFLEGYSQLNNTVDLQPWPSSPRAVFTSCELWFGDVALAYVADKVESGSRLIYGQHGGLYGIVDFFWAERHEAEISDKFLSWGWSDENRKKIKNFFILKKLKNFNPILRKKRTLLLVYNSLPRYSGRLDSEPKSSQLLSYINDGFRFFKKLTNTVKKSTVVRLYPHEYGWEHRLRWTDFDPKICVDDGKAPIHRLIKNARICVFTNNSTGYLETIAANIPTTVFWDPEVCPVRDVAAPYFEELSQCGVFHSTPESAAIHLNTVWDNIDDWWFSKPVQNTLQRFRSRYCRTSNDIVSELVDEIENEG